MVLEEMSAVYSPWSMLQQPAHTSAGITASFRSLLAAIDQGWQVEEPVQVLPTARGDTWIYYIVLTHTTLSQTCRLFVPAVSEVEQYVEQNHYQVIEGSYY
jgi:hypothetical protein